MPFPATGEPAIFGVINFLTSNVMLPVGGILIALFVGVAMPRESVAQELGLDGTRLAVLRFLLSVVAPIAIAALLVINLVGSGGGGE